MKEERIREDRVLQALAALAENDLKKDAPPEVEARLLSAFHSRHSRRIRRIRHARLWAGIATLAAGLLIALLWPSRAPMPAMNLAPPVAQVPEATRPAPVAVAVAANVPRTPHKVSRKVAAVRQSERQPQPREVVTDFFPLMNPVPSFERGQMLRVQLPAAAMQTVGLPVREENLGELVQADVLVGEEGMPRAIRFVRFDVK